MKIVRNASDITMILIHAAKNAYRNASLFRHFKFRGNFKSSQEVTVRVTFSRVYYYSLNNKKDLLTVEFFAVHLEVLY